MLRYDYYDLFDLYDLKPCKVTFGQAEKMLGGKDVDKQWVIKLDSP